MITITQYRNQAINSFSEFGKIANEKVNTFGTNVNHIFNKTIGRFCDESCKITCSDKTDSLLNSLRSLDGFLKGISDIPTITSEFLLLIPTNFAQYVPTLTFVLPDSVKVAGKIIADAKNTLTFLEVTGKIKKWRELDISKTSKARIANKAFNIGQKVLESVFLIPAKWGFYDLGKFCLRIGSWTGRAITPLHFTVAKDLFMIASSACAVYASKSELAKFSSELGALRDETERKKKQMQIKEATIGRNFDLAKASLGVCSVITNVVAVSTMGPAGLAAVKVAGFAAGWFVCGFGVQRTIYSGWINPRS